MKKMFNINSLFLKTLIIVISLIFLFLFVISIYLLNGFVLMNLWNWFVVPVCVFVKKISLIQAIGVYSLISFLVAKRIDNKKDAWKAIGFAYIAPILSLIFGYIITLFL